MSRTSFILGILLILAVFLLIEDVIVFFLQIIFNDPSFDASIIKYTIQLLRALVNWVFSFIDLLANSLGYPFQSFTGITIVVMADKVAIFGMRTAAVIDKMLYPVGVLIGATMLNKIIVDKRSQSIFSRRGG
jgi:hypothetical protein